MKMLGFCVLAVLALSGCTMTRGLYSRGSERPAVVVNAPVQLVRDVITDSARRRGSEIRLVGDGLVLEAPLAESRDEVVTQCGAHRPGRRTRAVLRTTADGGATILTEERYIVDGTNICALQLFGQDLEQSRGALTRIKENAEAVRARTTRAS